MDPIHLLALLYAINGLIAVLGYWPQTVKLYRAKERPEEFSLTGWSIWVYTTLITFTYATLINGDPLFMFVSGMYALGTVSIWALVLTRKRT